MPSFNSGEKPPKQILGHEKHNIIGELSDALVRHRFLYEKGVPEISDHEFDALEEKLRTLDPHHPALSYIGPAPGRDNPKVPHDEPMLSLNKTYVIEDLLAWVGDHASVGMLKIDGVSLALIYQDGKLQIAKTRGNGQWGEDVTQKAVWVSGIPSHLSGETGGTIEIRGEIGCTESQFAKLSHQMAELGLEKPSSPRNIVAGLLGRKTYFELARYFTFFAFGAFRKIPTPVKETTLAESIQDFSTEWEQFQWLQDQGFRVPDPELITNPQGINLYLEKTLKKIDEDEIPLDGAVFAYNDRALHRQLGNTAHHPRSKLSFKWQGQTAIAKVQRVEWATSRLGVVTPVAVIEPVYLSGATISNVTLHNAAYVQNYDIKPGDSIEIVRSGEVIPKFLRIVEATPGKATIPTNCPSCQSALEFDEVRLRCKNLLNCPAQQLGILLNWVQTVEIDDLSEKRMIQLLEKGLVHTPADLYDLTIDKLLSLPQTKEKLATKLYQNIQKTKTLPLVRFLNGLGIEGMGATTWEKLLEHFPSLDRLRALRPEDVAQIHGFAEKSAHDLVKGLRDRAALLDELLSKNLVFETPKPSKKTLSGVTDKTFVITGSLSQPREQIAAAIKAGGGKVSGSVSKTTFAVVTNDTDTNSSKLKKAKELGIQIIDEAQLQKLLSPVSQS